jgi:NAD(P)-dependent dehydrogenase (short-subunit alcohol dehydrogenase family)
MTDSKVALIIGAGSAAGQQAARALTAAGFRVALNDQMPNRIESLAAELGSQAAAYPIDVSRKLALQTMLQSILEDWARIDVLVFVPTTAPETPLLDMDEWDWHRTIDSNLTAAFLSMQSVGRIMRQLGSGVIVNILELEYFPSPVFRAAVAGLQALSEAAKGEFASHNIQVHCLSVANVDALLNLVTKQIPS